MTDVSKRPERLCWIGVGIACLLQIAGIVLAKRADCTTIIPAHYAGTVLFFLAWLSGGRVRLARRKLEEEADLEQYRQDHASTELFDDSDEAVKLAERTNRHYIKYFVPSVTLILGLTTITIGLYYWNSWNSILIFPKSGRPMEHAVLAMGLVIGALIGGSYYIGVSREKGCRWLRPLGAWMLFCALLFLLATIALVGEGTSTGIERLDLRCARIAMALLIALGAELVVNFVIEFYRPRSPREEERPLYESKLLALFTEPGGIARNVAASLDYQFGFKVSEVWFYRFLERTVIPFAVAMVVLLWLQTCIVVINPEENGIREAFGEVLSKTALTPGIYFKLPSPFGRIYKFSVERVQEIPIGYTPGGKDGAAEEDAMEDPEMAGDKTGRVIVWSKSHAKDEKNFIVASRPEFSDTELREMDAPGRLPVTVYFLSAAIPLYFKVDNLYDYAYGHRDPLKTLEQLATRELVSYLANVDFFDVLTRGRAEGALELQKRIQAAATEHKLGIQVVFVGLQGLHPPVRVGKDFDEVVAAMEEKHEQTLKAEAYAIEKKPEAEGVSATRISQARSYANNRTFVSHAEAERFGKQRLAFAASSKLFVLNSFLDVLENEGSASRKYVVATQKGSEVFVLDLQKKMRPDLLDLDLDKVE